MRRLPFLLLLVVVTLLGGEVAARVDDWIREGIPFAAAPSHEDLTLRDSLGLRGRPQARFKKWRLNNVGFRSPDIERAPPAACARVMVLGASEAFGYYEAEGKEFPAQLADSLRPARCYEVSNAAVAGLSLAGLLRQWRGWLAQFQPDIVVLYPSPGFYLADRQPQLPAAVASTTPATPVAPGAAEPTWGGSRLLARLADRVVIPGPLQRIRVRRSIARALTGKPAGWQFDTLPTDRLTLFAQHLDTLVVTIQRTGAAVILATHAIAFSDTLGNPDPELLTAWRQITPRPTGATLVGFNQAARRPVFEVANARGTLVVDVDRHLSGCRPWFGDFVHFTDLGASITAGLLARGVRATPVPRLGWGSEATEAGVETPASCPTLP